MNKASGDLSDSNQEIRRKLREALLKAQQAHSDAQQKFASIVKDVPSGIPHPDGTLLVQLASQQSSRSLALYEKALKRYTDFLLHGTIPDDLPGSN